MTRTALLFSSVAMTAAFGLTPALAQDMSTKEQWGSFRDFFRERGVMIASQGAVDQGDTLTLTDVRIFALADPASFHVDIPRMEVAQAEGLLVLTPDALFTATATEGRTERVFTITHDGAIQTAVSPDAVTLNMDFGALTLALTSAMRGGTELPETFSITLGGVDMDVTATRAGDADASLVTQSLSYAYDLGEVADDNPFGQSASFDGEGLSLTFTGRRLDLLETIEDMDSPDDLFGQGFSAQLDMTFGPGGGESTSNVMGAPMTLATQSGAGTFSVGFVDGRFDMTGVVADLDYDVISGPFEGAFDAGAMSFGFGAPLVVMPDHQPAYYRIALENLITSGPVLALAGLQEFEGETVNLNIDLNADVRITQPLTERSMEGAVPPFDISTLTLANFLFSAGQASLTGSGAFTFEGGLQASIGAGVPNGTGDFLFELIGGNAFLQRLVTAGIVPQEQMFVAQMMMNGLGQSVGEDHLRSEIAIRPGGVVTVNGAPLPF